MASKATVRPIQGIIKRSKPLCEYTSSCYAAVPIRRISSSTPRADAQYDENAQPRPRWTYTPERMKIPYRTRLTDPDKWECNNDPIRLDRFYIKFLGVGGDKLLNEEVKWLAITHKSFDQGRRGFNDRLAFLGRRILNLQATLALVNSSRATKLRIPVEEPENRTPFTHPALDGLANLSEVPVSQILTKQRLAGLATQIGMRDIIRWKPRLIKNLDGSGIETVLNTSLYAIIGALALQKGGDVAAEVAREKVLKPLGIS